MHDSILIFSGIVIGLSTYLIYKLITGVKMNAEQLRQGIFNLRTRRLGTVAELMIKRMLKLKKGQSLFHDLYDDINNYRVEVKFSTVQKKTKFEITEDTVLDAILESSKEERSVRFEEWKKHKFDCNIQQIKKNEFEILYYGMFFFDKIVIFKIKNEEIGKKIFYSDKQHKGNLGEGQFHINDKTLQTHLDNYLYKIITYDDLLRRLT